MAAVFLLFGRACWFGFCSFDDPDYVTQNLHVQSGLTSESVRWAFTSTEYYNWFPLTWLSLELDIELWGFNPAGFHLTNLVLHAANTLMLFWFVYWITGELAAGACVAALFAIHPLHVESVVWITERKDVLSTFFWMLTLLAYAWYAAVPCAERYSLVVVSFCLGLMAKQMLVTLPFVMILLDYWPLRRWPVYPVTSRPARKGEASSSPKFMPATLARIIAEKLPLVGISAALSVLTAVVQTRGGAVISNTDLPLVYRLMNVPVAYVAYLAKAAWPAHLAVFYPHPERSQSPALTVVTAMVVLAITLAALRYWRQAPYFVVGWLWYLGTLVPVIGLVQIGQQGIADRYTYVPLIGIFLAVVWGMKALIENQRLAPSLARALAIAALASFSACTWVQVGYWRDDVTLWGHSLAVAGPHPKTYDGVGQALLAKGDPAAAFPYLSQAAEWAPGVAGIRGNVGVCLFMMNRYEEGKRELLECVRLDPKNFLAHYNLGKRYLEEGRFSEAAEHLQRSLEIHPGNVQAQKDLEEVNKSVSNERD